MILINEKITFVDLILKYTLRDTLLGLLRGIPGTIGVGSRLLILPLFLKKTGTGLTVKEGVVLKFPEKISMGSHVGIGEYTIIDGNGKVEIGDYTRIAHHVSIVSFEHNFRDRKVPIKLQGKKLKKVIIGDDVWIGAGSVVLAGVVIGKGAVVGANSVVNSDVAPYTIVAGSPAKIIGKRV
jgi:acetyltransferase-like isoleucine patch superfamily enzyme